MKTYYTNARLLLEDEIRPGNVEVTQGRISAFDPQTFDSEPIDCQGKLLTSGLVDSYVWAFSEASCIAGGITQACLMPTVPPRTTISHSKTRPRILPRILLHRFGAATRNLEGREIAEFITDEPCVGYATGRGAIPDSLVMFRLLQYATLFETVILSHAEDPYLTADCCATDGPIATGLGLPSAPAIAECLMVMRDLLLAEQTGARIHFPQITCADSIAAIRSAKARGVQVTCGVTPAHFLLNDSAIIGYRTYARLSPPLRSEDDRLAVIEGLKDGTIDVISSGHDPRSQEDKRLPFAQARPGMTACEILLPLALTLVHDGHLTLLQLMDKLTVNPQQIFSLPKTRLAIGKRLTPVLIDEQKPWKIEADKFADPARNTPFDDFPVMGKAETLQP